MCVRECAEGAGADHERGTVVEAAPIHSCRVVLGYLRAGRELDSAERAAQGRLELPVCSAVFSEEQYRPGTLGPRA